VYSEKKNHKYQQQKKRRARRAVVIDLVGRETIWFFFIFFVYFFLFFSLLFLNKNNNNMGAYQSGLFPKTNAEFFGSFVPVYRSRSFWAMRAERMAGINIANSEWVEDQIYTAAALGGGDGRGGRGGRRHMTAVSLLPAVVIGNIAYIAIHAEAEQHKQAAQRIFDDFSKVKPSQAKPSQAKPRP
jgi:hypothetical protein